VSGARPELEVDELGDGLRWLVLRVPRHLFRRRAPSGVRASAESDNPAATLDGGG